ncbi:MAG: cation:proton antiporter, partial [Planctomycetia bacterium]
MDAALVQNLLVLVAAGFVAGVLCRLANVSMLIGYILVGAVVGSGVLQWITPNDKDVQHFAEIGVLLLLFTIGLELSLDELSRLAKHLFIGGPIQMALSAIPAAVLLYQLSVPWQGALLLGGAVALSSTVLVYKALAETGRTVTPSGRRAVGVLLFQDVSLVPLLLIIPLLTVGSAAADKAPIGAVDFALLGVKAVGLVVGVAVLRLLVGKWAVPLLVKLRSPELVVLFVLVLFGGASTVVHLVGLPAAMGAFGAGLIFSDNRLTKQIEALLLPFRESFAAIFFVSLGLLFDPMIFWREGTLMFGALFLLIAWKTAAAGVAVKCTGLSWKASLGVGLGLAHMGEFSFVLTLEAMSTGLISQ